MHAFRMYAQCTIRIARAHRKNWKLTMYKIEFVHIHYDCHLWQTKSTPLQEALKTNIIMYVGDSLNGWLIWNALFFFWIFPILFFLLGVIVVDISSIIPMLRRLISSQSAFLIHNSVGLILHNFQIQNVGFKWFNN